MANGLLSSLVTQTKPEPLTEAGAALAQEEPTATPQEEEANRGLLGLGGAIGDALGIDFSSPGVRPALIAAALGIGQQDYQGAFQQALQTYDLFQQRDIQKKEREKKEEEDKVAGELKAQQQAFENKLALQRLTLDETKALSAEQRDLARIALTKKAQELSERKEARQAKAATTDELLKTFQLQLDVKKEDRLTEEGKAKIALNQARVDEAKASIDALKAEEERKGRKLDLDTFGIVNDYVLLKTAPGESADAQEVADLYSYVKDTGNFTDIERINKMAEASFAADATPEQLDSIVAQAFGEEGLALYKRQQARIRSKAIQALKTPSTEEGALGQDITSIIQKLFSGTAGGTPSATVGGTGLSPFGTVSPETVPNLGALLSNIQPSPPMTGGGTGLSPFGTVGQPDLRTLVEQLLRNLPQGTSGTGTLPTEATIGELLQGNK